MADKYVSLKDIRYREFLNRENDFRHADYDTDMRQYQLLQSGDPRAVEEADRRYRSSDRVALSDDPLRSKKYMFVAAAALASRFAVQGGMSHELAFNTSDLYIQKMDRMKTPEELNALLHDMFSFYTRQVASIEKGKVCSKPVLRCMDYIYYHLNEKIRLSDLAQHVGLNTSYLSELFKKETGLTLSDYILQRRIEAASNMLRYSDYTFVEISSTLAYSTQSHFIHVFKKATGMTPRQYRAQYSHQT